MNAGAQDPYCYPGTNILKNLKGIRDPGMLEMFEADSAAYNIAGLMFNPVTGPFNSSRLLETHRRIFCDVYEWAGQLRRNTGTMTKARKDGYSVTYGDSAYVQSELAMAFASLQGEKYLFDLKATTLSKRLAHYYCEIDAIHPFREGNSRTLRQFVFDLARSAGYRLDWPAASKTEEQRQDIFRARDAGFFGGDSSKLAQIIAMAMKPSITP
jgi:cell filamentation protein